MTERGVLLFFVVKVTVRKLQAPRHLGVLMVIVPAVSEPLTDTVPPPPSAVPLLRDGVGPPAEMWWVRLRSPLICNPPVVMDGADTAPRKLAEPLTFRLCWILSWPCIDTLPVT